MNLPDSITIDPTPRRADGEFMAHVRITTPSMNGGQARIFMSGDLAGFEERDDAIEYARKWAYEWVDALTLKAARAERQTFQADSPV